MGCIKIKQTVVIFGLSGNRTRHAASLASPDSVAIACLALTALSEKEIGRNSGLSQHSAQPSYSYPMILSRPRNVTVSLFTDDSSLHIDTDGWLLPR